MSAVEYFPEDRGLEIVGSPGARHDGPSKREVDEALSAASRLVPPLWSLRNFVAVNPYLGWSDLGFDEATRELDRLAHASSFLPRDYYQAAFHKGIVQREDLIWALESLGLGSETHQRIQELLRPASLSSGERVSTLAESIDAGAGSEWAPRVVEWISAWMAGRLDLGQAAWSQPARGDVGSLWFDWKQHACIDRNPEFSGLAGFRAFVAELPDDPREAIAELCAELGVPEARLSDWLSRELATVLGWAGYLRYLAREDGRDGLDELAELLAIRLAYDAGIGRSFGVDASNAAAQGRGPVPLVQEASLFETEHEVQHVWQRAFERAYQRRLISSLRPLEGETPEVPERPEVQAVFCIDVRSERLRRNLENLTQQIETIGFAGFFGFPIALEKAGHDTSSARCPVLLRPPYLVKEVETPGSDASSRVEHAHERHRSFQSLRKQSVGSFPLVETVGHWFGLRLLTDSLGWTHPRAGGALFDSEATRDLAPSLDAEPGRPELGLPLEDRVDLAEGALRGMGLIERFAPLVLICGHEGSSSNNPYGSGLDCGACGGHSGDANARVAVAVLNDRRVRAALAGRGIEIPDDTLFVAGVHDTTRDRVRLVPQSEVPLERMRQLEIWLGLAGERCSSERAGLLGETRGDSLARRATDWSEVRPEWGLAGNAAFIAAPRSATRSIDLEGRTFLHDYCEERDPSGSILEQILTAPLVVASWINLQYYGSTVDNEVFGSGDKTIHNVVGRLGVMLGNRSDLQHGLPWQSVHDGHRYVHEPLRLTACIAAEPDRIEAVLEAHSDLADLVGNEWILLVAWDVDGGSFRQVRRTSEGWTWDEVCGPSADD